MTEMVGEGKVPPIVKEWVEKCVGYWVEHRAEHGEESKKGLAFWHVFNRNYDYLPLGWERVKLLVSLFGCNIIGNVILSFAARRCNVVMVKGLLELCTWEVDVLNTAVCNTVVHSEDISEKHEEQTQIMTMLLEHGLYP